MGITMNEKLLSGAVELRLRKVMALLTSPLRALVVWRRMRSAANRLGALPDHMLKDIALSRGEIPFVASQDADWSRFR